MKKQGTRRPLLTGVASVVRWSHAVTCDEKLSSVARSSPKKRKTTPLTHHTHINHIVVCVDTREGDCHLPATVAAAGRNECVPVVRARTIRNCARGANEWRTLKWSLTGLAGVDSFHISQLVDNGRTVVAVDWKLHSICVRGAQSNDANSMLAEFLSGYIRRLFTGIIPEMKIIIHTHKCHYTLILYYVIKFSSLYFCL